MRSLLRFMLVVFALFGLPLHAQGNGSNLEIAPGAPEVVTFKDGFEDFVGCGDGLVAGAEACDDQNQNSGDGCSSSCSIEDGFICSDEPSVCIPET